MRDRNRPTTSPAPARRVPRGQALLETHFDLIQGKLRQLSRSGGLPDAEAEEFRSWALFKLVDDDYRILGSWRGRSSFPTFLGVVLTNLLRDYRAHLWGKWRPSAVSRRKGEAAVLLERLLRRDGLSFDEALERMSALHGIALTADEAARLAAAFLPRRPERRQVREEELLHFPVDGQVEARVQRRERARTACHLCEALLPLLRSLPGEHRALLKLYFFDGLSMAAIAPLLGRPQRELYTIRDHCLQGIRRCLAEAGLGSEQVGELLDDLQCDFGLEAQLSA